MINLLSKYYKYCQLLSIDVAVGAVCMAILATKITQTTMPWAWWILLPFSVWIIYTTDHWLDAQKAQKNYLSERHYFHLKHQNSIKNWLFMFMVFCAILALFFLPLSLFIGGAMIAISVILYLFYSYFITTYAIPKEIFIAILYTIGIWYGPSMYSNNWNIYTYIFCFSTFATTLANLLIFSYLSKKEDAKSGFNSIALQFSDKFLIAFIYTLICICVIIQLFAIITFCKATFCVLLMNFILLAIFKYRNFFKINDAYRMLGDAVFFVGAVA